MMPWQKPLTPSQALHDMVVEVATKMGVPVPEIEIERFNPFKPFDPFWAASGIGFRPKPDDPKTIEAYHMMEFAESIEHAMQPDQLRAVIAHELGHIADRQSERLAKVFRQGEYTADSYAAKFGYGQGMIDILKLRHRMSGNDPRPAKYWSHPSHDQRIKKLQEAMK